MKLRFWLLMMDVFALPYRYTRAAYFYCVTAAGEATDWSESEGRDG